MAEEKMQNVPTPGLIYPKSSALYLLTRVQELTANMADLVNEAAKRNARIKELGAEPKPGLGYPTSSGHYLLLKTQELTANVADMIQELCQQDAYLAQLEEQAGNKLTVVPNAEAAD